MPLQPLSRDIKVEHYLWNILLGRFLKFIDLLNSRLLLVFYLSACLFIFLAASALFKVDEDQHLEPSPG